MMTHSFQYQKHQEQMQLITALETLPHYFLDQQQTALASYEHLSLPLIERLKYENWPLFDTTIVAKEGRDPILAQGEQSKFHSSASSGIQLVHRGNSTVFTSLPPELAAQGVLVMDLFEAMVTHPELIEAHLFKVSSSLEDKLMAYHTAYLNGGVFVYVPAFVELKQTVTVTLQQDSHYRQAFNKHVLIVAEAGSRLDYMELLETTGDEENSATIVVEVIAKAGAKVNYSSIDQLGKRTTAYVKRTALVAQDAAVHWALGMMNDGDTILDVDTWLKGTGSVSHVSIASISNDKQVQVADTKIVNLGHYSQGNILQHGVILDQAVLTFNGTGLIEKDAKYSDSQQESRVLMLSDQARGDANPILLIEEFEVTAGHAASVGQLDEEQLYYLMSRGLPRQEAEFLVIRGFLGPVLKRMPSQEAREQLGQTIDVKLESLSS